MNHTDGKGNGRRLGLGLPLRLAVVGILSALLYALVAGRSIGRPVFLSWGFPQADFLIVFLAYFFPLFLLCLLGAWWTFRERADDPRTLGLILLFGLLFRVLVLWTPPVLSSDIFRYVWDARVQASGINPYLSRPADFQDEEVRRDPLFQQQNRPEARTIYPPLAQYAFRAVRGLAGEDVTAFKALMLLGDLVTLVLLVCLLGELGLPRSRIILYAWHPLVVFEVAGSGHVDALAIPWILLAVLAWRRQRHLASGMALGAATLVKVFPILLLPALLGRRRLPVLFGFGIIVALGYLPFLPGAGLMVLGHLPRFLADPGETFNPSLMGIIAFLALRVTETPVLWASRMGRIALVVVLAWLLRRGVEGWDDLLNRLWIVAAVVVLFTLTLHPWYLLWLVPFLAIQPRAEWIYLTGTIAISYSFYLVAPPAPGLLSLLEYVPFLLIASRRWRQYARIPSAAPRLGYAGKTP